MYNTLGSDQYEQLPAEKPESSRMSKEKKLMSGQLMEDQRKTAPYKKAEDSDLMDRLKQRVVELEGQLDLVHNEYEGKIQELTAKTVEKNEFFLNLIQQMQQRHSEEINYYRTLVEGFEEEKKQMSSIEVKMNQIGAGIEDILRESAELTRTNEELERKLLERDKHVENLKREAGRSTQNIDGYQQKIDEYEKLRLKNAKKSRDMLQLMDEADREVSNLITNSRYMGNEICPQSRMRKRECNHCCLSSLSNKYSDMMNEEE